MKNLYLLLLSLSVVMVCTACSDSAKPIAEATVAGGEVTDEILPTATAVPPTKTPIPPSATPVPTNTPVPATQTPAPTNTLTATATPEATETAQPTASPTSVLPEATATTDLKILAAEAFERGMEKYDLEEWDAAIAEFEKTLELDPGLSMAYVALGYSYAFGPGEFNKSIELLEKYLELASDTENRANIESDLERLRELAASRPVMPEIEVPTGKAVFVFINYTHLDWNIDVGPYFIQSPGRAPNEESSISTVVIEPGTYTWKGTSADGSSVISNYNRDVGFEFTVAAGEITVQSVGDRID